MKRYIAIAALLFIGAVTASACLFCRYCPDTGQYICVNADYPCQCINPGGGCVGVKCPDGYIEVYCCQKIQASTYKQLAPGTDQWRINLSNGGHIYVRTDNRSSNFDPLESFRIGRVTVREHDEHGKILTAVSAEKEL